MNTPAPEEVSEHFKNAKEIKCLQLGINISIAYVTRFQYHEEENSYKVNGGIVTVWNEKDGYAPIIKNKCVPGECKNCEKCKESKKTTSNLL